MRVYTVKAVTKQDTLTIVQLEPEKAPLFLEDEIPSGCLQHIIANLSKHGRTLEGPCNKMCRILCTVHMDDNNSRNAPISATLIQSIWLRSADNKDTFRHYRGIEVLIEMFKLYRNSIVAKALSHVLSGNGKNKTY